MGTFGVLGVNMGVFGSISLGFAGLSLDVSLGLWPESFMGSVIGWEMCENIHVL